MYPGEMGKKYADRPAFIMASTGKEVTYAEFEGRANQLAHYLRSINLKFKDHYAIFMENNDRFLEANSAGERAGLYYTCINSYLTASEVSYIINNSESQVLITSSKMLPTVIEAEDSCPGLKKVLVVGAEKQSLSKKILDYEETISNFPTHPIDDECLGTSMLYSSGTTGRPKGILRPLPFQKPDERLPVFNFLMKLWSFDQDNVIYLSPAPLYHSAPLAAASFAIGTGATTIIMEQFDPLEFLRLIEKYRVTHSQLVPTMFSRMLKLSEKEKRMYDLSSHKYAIHGAAPCPEKVKYQMIDWWGPIIYEYYGATEAFGFAYCNSEEWLEHPGTVGKIVSGDLAVLDDNMKELPQGEPGTLWFKPTSEFEYFNDPERTSEAYSEDKRLTTVWDVGYTDSDGYLYLTDRKTFMIISGGVNIYPQECEDLLIPHPKVFDAAVFGVPNEDLGEEVKAVVQPIDGIKGDEALTKELLDYLSEHLSRQKIPRSIDYIDKIPRLPTGKLYKRLLRDEYWGRGSNKIVEN